MNNFCDGDLVIVNFRRGKTSFSLPHIVDQKQQPALRLGSGFAWCIEFLISEHSQEIGMILDASLTRWNYDHEKESPQYSPTVKVLLRNNVVNVPIDNLMIINKNV